MSQFFANRIVTGESDTSSDLAIVVDYNDNDRGGEGPENNEEIPDLVDTEHDGDKEPIATNIGNNMSGSIPINPHIYG